MKNAPEDKKVAENDKSISDISNDGTKVGKGTYPSVII